MILKKRRTKEKKNFFLNKFLIFYFFSTLSILLIFLVFIFTSSLFNKKVNIFLDHFSKAGRFEYLYIFNMGFNALKSNFYHLEKLDLEINFKEILKVENFRKTAIKNKSLGNSENIPIVKGNLILNSKKYEAELRLKGERLIHFKKKNKSSYRVKLKKNNFILGINKFSLQKPRVRNYIHEWLFHEMAGEEGLIKLKYEFLDFYINGSSQGLYVLEEAFGKELIERNKRRNGPIFAFDDNMVNFSTEFKVDEDNPFFEIYNKKYWSLPENVELVNVASQKLRDFINGERKIENTFDLDLFAKFFAIIDATYTYHATSPGTLRLYYNPINGLFEPIPFDGQREHPNYRKYNSSFNEDILIDKDKVWWVKKFFFYKDKINYSFYNKYIKSLKRISSKKYLNNFFELRNKKIKEINSHIYSDYFLFTNGYDFGPGLYYFSKNDLFYRAEVIKKRIDSESRNVQIIKKSKNEYNVKVFFKSCLECQKYNTLTHIKAKSIICKIDNNEYGKKKIFKIDKQLNIFKNTVIKSNLIKDLECTQMVFYDKIRKENFVSKINKLNSTHPLTKIDNYKKDDFKEYFTIKKNTLLLKKDTTLISDNLYIPSDLKVIIKSGQNIILTDNAFIFSKSAWIAKGSSNKPIKISGIKNNFGGGLIIDGANNKSELQNVKFSYLSGLKKKEGSVKGLIIYGAINFHKTNVDIKDVIFEKISSEDAINIINSKFLIQNAEFRENNSDSIDFDFSEGEIKNVIFEYIGNDAIDFSGSNVTINNAKFFDIKDKVISIGENSSVKIKNIEAVTSNVGIATKDGSIVYAEDIVMNEVKIPFAAFNKKFEYGNSSLYLKNININNFEERWLVDNSSRIFYENAQVGEISKDIMKIIYKESLN
jgi:hypothetical protein